MLADAIRSHAVRLMGADKADELAAAIARCEGDTGQKRSGGHKLASDAAAKLFSLGKLRQAEKAYLELVQKHGDRESYIGLARTQAALEDEPAAIETLREGAAKMARAGDRANAVSLLAEAVALAPLDMSAHRRLAAALANQGDMNGAVDEYRRFVDAALSMGEGRRALLEIAYGRETLGELPKLVALVDRIQNPNAQANPIPTMPGRFDGPVDLRLAALRLPTPSEPRLNEPPTPTVVRAASPSSAEQPSTTPKPLPQMQAMLKSAAANGTPIFVKQPPAPGATKPTTSKQAPKQSKPVASAPKATSPEPRPVAQAVKAEAVDPRLQVLSAAPARPATEPVVQPAPVKDATKDTPKTRPSASETAVIFKEARTFTHVQPMDLEAPVDMLLRTGVVKPQPAKRPALDLEPILKSLTPTGSGLDAAAMASQRAALLTSARDIRATDAALDAAQRLLALGKLQSASDVLLDLIAHGFADREAQRLLIEVDCALGRRDVAKEKCQLLGNAYRLDGRRDVADDVDRLARIL